MSEPVAPSADARAMTGSERMRLARSARDAALRVPGVVSTDIGPSGLFVTVAGAERLEGVICVATKAGGWDVSLRLVCRMVPLLALGAQVEAAVVRAGRVAAIVVERVDVTIAELAEGA